jgi:uncharacterized protein
MATCPICEKSLAYADDHARRRLMPFCSERCKLIDLGAWMGERYRVPSQTPPDALDGTETTVPELGEKDE